MVLAHITIGGKPGQVHFLKKWLRVEKPAGIAPYTSRVVDVAAEPAAAYAVCMHGIEVTLGGTLESADPVRRHIEARFGLVNSERLSVDIEPGDAGTGSRVRVVARPALGTGTAAPSSTYVDALCAYVRMSAPK